MFPLRVNNIDTPDKSKDQGNFIMMGKHTKLFESYTRSRRNLGLRYATNSTRHTYNDDGEIRHVQGAATTAFFSWLKKVTGIFLAKQ